MEIILSRTAVKALRKCNKAVLIMDKIKEFAANPEHGSPNVTRLVGRPEFRLRVQDWRVIFRVTGNVMAVDDIGPRASIYRGASE